MGTQLTRCRFRHILQAVAALAAGVTIFPVLAAPSPSDTRSDAAALTQIAIAHYEHNDFGHAFDEFAEAAQRGNRLAQFDYAMMLMRGEGTVARPEEAVKWLRRAADNQMTHAQFAYGELFERGELVPRSLEEANKWYERAASGGHIEAQRALATNYFTGRGVPRDYGRAFAWYKKAAEGGDAPSQYIVGSYYERGEPGVVPQDLEQAKTWYGRAAAQGDVGALAKLRELVEKTYRAKHGDPPAAVRPSL
ncbi:tetratricopeptide repeat protein [Ralstonia sp. UBA689]|uniref:tetratricopeptide repeat protein n=1 Tax=Ralstonia sp. UBA689 TaxID=1947373 RepID=UPI0025E817A7|nr:tetratricopeptide repeat protein [Ralstonia sp. UBA689]